jgi:Ribbon-helix-helix protein, copG family
MVKRTSMNPAGRPRGLNRGPGSTRNLIQVKITDELRERLDRAVKETGRSVSAEVRRALETALPA